MVLLGFVWFIVARCSLLVALQDVAHNQRLRSALGVVSKEVRSEVAGDKLEGEGGKDVAEMVAVADLLQAQAFAYGCVGLVCKRC